MKKITSHSTAGTFCGLARFVGKIGFVGAALVLAQTGRADTTMPPISSAVYSTAGGLVDGSTFNIVNNGSPTGAGETFGVIDFTVPAGTTFQQAQTLTLFLTETSPMTDVSGQLDFFLSEDTTTALTDPTLKYKASFARGIDGQFQPRFNLGSKTYTPGVTGDVDKFKFNLSGDAQTYLTSQINSGGPIRILVGANSAVTATFGGFGSATKPKLTVADAPAPSSLLVSLLGVPGVGLLIRRRKGAK